MIESVEAYLEKLNEELAGCDPATRQDALADAEEYLRNALEQGAASGTDVSEAQELSPIIEKYGSPEEIANAYRELETRIQPALAELKPDAEKSFFNRFLSVISDPHAWGALLYLTLSMITGIVYFTWAITGLSLSLSLFLLIFGFPFTILFLLSVRSIALLEGRIVEGLLGMRMPRRPLFTNREAGWWEQVKELLLERRTWTAVIYMILQLPLGVIYFTIFVCLIATSWAFMISPIMELIFSEPVIQIGLKAYHLQIWQMPLAVAGGFILFLTSMHLAKFIGRLHGSLAKSLLVGVL
jgi:uncharacterized membrane protein